MPSGVYTRTTKTRIILSRAKLGKEWTPQHKANHKKAVSRGKNHYLYKGVPRCVVCGKRVTQHIYKYCKRCTVKGKRNPAWQGGITPKNRLRRFKSEYREWRTKVFERDNYTCVLCGARGVELNADHVKPWAEYPSLRYNLSNGRTLCVPCHKKTPTYKNHDKHKIPTTS